MVVGSFETTKDGWLSPTLALSQINIHGGLRWNEHVLNLPLLYPLQYSHLD